MLITVDADQASDAWGFVGVVKVGEYQAYRTVESFATPAEAISEMQAILGTVLGEMLAGAEWRRVRERRGTIPTRNDLRLGVLQHQPEDDEPT